MTAEPPPEPPATAAVDHVVVEAVRMVLSGVARTHGRFGQNIVAQMLWGSNSANVTKYRLDQLSTYGLLHHVTRDEVLLLMDKLLAAGLLAQTERERHRPLVHLTDLGGEVMRGSVELEDDLGLPRGLLAKLRRKPQRTPGRSEGQMPAQRPTKVAPSFVPPQAAPERAGILGPATAPTRATQEAGATSPGPDHSEFATAAVKPSFYWTWRLLSTGYTGVECEQIRGCDAARLLDHVLQAAEHNLAIRAEWFLTPQQIAELTALIGATTPAQLRPILEQVSPGLTRQHVQLFLRCRG